MSTLAANSRARASGAGRAYLSMLLPPTVFAATIGLAIIINAFGASPGLRSILAAPAYYLVPFGVGLLLTQPVEAAITRSQRALLAYFTGLIAICAIMVAREHTGPELLSIHFVTSFVFIIAVAGFAVGRRLFQWNDGAREAAVDFTAVVPVFAVAYAFRFGVFSDYPVTDLFQATHLMKGALEFGRFDLINRFTADAYVPVLPVMEGLMVRYLGFEPVYGVWSLSALSTVLKFLTLRSVMQVLLESRQARIFAIAAVACFMSSFAPTNGDLAMLASLLILSMAGSSVSRQPPIWVVAFVALVGVAIILGLASARQSPLLFVALLAAICFLALAVRRFGTITRGLAVFLAIITVTPVHRSAIAFIPLAVGCGVVFIVMREWAARRAVASYGVVVFCLAVTALAVVIVPGLLGWILLHPEEDLRRLDIYQWILKPILRRDLSTDPDVLLGSGPKIALFELARAMSPAFVAVTAIVTALALVKSSAGATTASSSVDTGHTTAIAWTIAVILGCTLLIGVPFVYRSGFLVITFFAVAFGHGLSRLIAEGAAKHIGRILLGLAAVYVLGTLLFMHCLIGPELCRKSDYLGLSRNYLTAIGIILIGIALAGVLSKRLIQSRPALLAGCLVLTFAFEVGVIRAYFMPYGYGQLDAQGTRAISHLSHEEIKLAAALRRFGRSVVLVSDPFTMSNLRALTGLNSLVSFSNLDTMSLDSVDRLRAWMKQVLVGDAVTCVEELPMMVTGGSAGAPELNYWLARTLPHEAGRQALRRFGYRDSFLLTPYPKSADADTKHKWLEGLMWINLKALMSDVEDDWAAEPMVLLVINSKTVAWALERRKVGYFPDVSPLDAKLIEHLAKRCDMRLHDGRFALLKFPMTTD